MLVSRIVKHIGSRKQLFVDENVVAETVNLSRNLHQVEKHPNNPILKSEQQWEFALERGASNPNVLYNVDEKIFKIWYSTFQHTCYAISEDGLNWERPKLGLVEFEGSKENNIIDGRGHRQAYQWIALLS